MSGSFRSMATRRIIVVWEALGPQRSTFTFWICEDQKTKEMLSALSSFCFLLGWSMSIRLLLLEETYGFTNPAFLVPSTLMLTYMPIALFRLWNRFYLLTSWVKLTLLMHLKFMLVFLVSSTLMLIYCYCIVWLWNRFYLLTSWVNLTLVMHLWLC